MLADVRRLPNSLLSDPPGPGNLLAEAVVAAVAEASRSATSCCTSTAVSARACGSSAGFGREIIEMSLFPG